MLLVSSASAVQYLGGKIYFSSLQGLVRDLTIRLRSHLFYQNTLFRTFFIHIRLARRWRTLHYLASQDNCSSSCGSILIAIGDGVMAGNETQIHLSDVSDERNIPDETTRAGPPQLSTTVPGHGDLGRGGEDDLQRTTGGLLAPHDIRFNCTACGFANIVSGATNAGHDSATIEGDEGIEDHKLWIENTGFVSIRAFNLALARHERCTCHPSAVEKALAMAPASWTPIWSSQNSDEGRRTDFGEEPPSLFFSPSASRSASVASFATDPLGPIGAELFRPPTPIYLFHGLPLQLGPDLPPGLPDHDFTMFDHPYPTVLSM